LHKNEIARAGPIIPHGFVFGNVCEETVCWDDNCSTEVLRMLKCIFVIFVVSSPTYFSREIDREVHGFFYLWYGNVDRDGAWKHWNHGM